MFLQINATLFDDSLFSWKDQYFLKYIYEFSDYVHFFDAVENSESSIYYLLMFSSACVFILAITLLFVYLHKALQNSNIYNEKVVDILRAMLLLEYSILFFPFFDVLISMFNCEAGSNHYMLKDVKCYSSGHIGLVIVSILSICQFLIHNLLTSTLYNETQPVKEDALARLDSNFEILMLIYRPTVSILTQQCSSESCSVAISVLSLLCSIYFLFQYFKYLPYYNTGVARTFGAMLGIYFWICLNAVLMEIYKMSGHIIVIALGIPPVVLVVWRLREQKIQWLMTTTSFEKFTMDIECLNQISTLEEWLNEVSKGYTAAGDIEIKLKGFINDHLQECINLQCMCGRIVELYDSTNDKYLSLSQFGLDEEEAIQDEINKKVSEVHMSEPFLQNFTKQLYLDALNKFDKSVSIHILLAVFYFRTLKNNHAAYHELKIAIKKRPNIFQQFTIYRYQRLIEMDVINQANKYKNIYGQLTNVKEFERLFFEMQKQIEKVCSHQVEFWTHLATVIPDLNFLNSQNNDIVDSAVEADQYWQQLCKINPNYPQALLMYAEYQTMIRNNIQLGKEYFDKANKVNFVGKSANDQKATNDVLFSDDAVIIHISGNKDQNGRVLKVSQAIKKCLGWDKQEVIGQNVSKIMPNIFAQKHQKFMEQFFKTGRRIMFNKERSLFSSHKTGYCRHVNILLKQMPSLKEGVQYVGMIKPQTTDNDFIITDFNGNIDSFSTGIGPLFNLNPVLINESNQINIQFIAPELVQFFNGRKDYYHQESMMDNSGSETTSLNFFKLGYQKGKTVGKSHTVFDSTRFSLPGGDVVTFCIPNNFLNLLKFQGEAGVKGSNRSKKNHTELPLSGNISSGLLSNNNQAPQSIKQSAVFRAFAQFIIKASSGKTIVKKPPDLKEVFNCTEYRNFDIKRALSVEIREQIIPLGNNEENGIKMLLFVIPKNQSDKRGFQDLQSFDKTNAETQKEEAVTGSDGQKNSAKNMEPELKLKIVKQKTNKPQKPSNNQIKHQKTNVMTKPEKKLITDVQAKTLSKKSTINVVPSIPQVLQNKPSFIHNATIDKKNSIDPKSNLGTQMIASARQTTKDHVNLIDDLYQDPDINQGSKKKIIGRQGTASKDRNMNLSEETSQHKLMMIDKELQKFERQETDEIEEDDQEQLETEVIDVKKDIALINIDLDDEESNVDKLISSKKGSQGDSHVFLDHVKQGSNSLSIPKPPQAKYISPQSLQNQTEMEPVPDLDSERVQPGTDRLLEETGTIRHPAFESEGPNHGLDDDRNHDFSDFGEDGEEDYENEFNESDQPMQEQSQHTSNGQSKSGSRRHLAGKIQSFNSFGADQQYPTQNEEEEKLVLLRNYQKQKQEQMNLQKGNQPIHSRRNSRSIISPRSKRFSSQGLDFDKQALLAQQKNQQEVPKHRKEKLRDYSRIVTNPKHQYYDEETCGSAYFRDFNMDEKEMNEDFQIKETFKKHMIAFHGGTHQQVLKTNNSQQKKTIDVKKLIEERKSNNRKKKVKKVAGADQSRSQSGSNTWSENEENAPEEDELLDPQIPQETNGNQTEEIEANNTTGQVSTQVEGDQTYYTQQHFLAGGGQGEELELSSVASTTQNQARLYQTLKQAIDEKFVPIQIRNLQKVANFMWIGILLLSIAYFVIETSLFEEIQNYIEIIINSEKRIDDIMTINLKLVDIALINEQILNVTSSQALYQANYNQTNSNLTIKRQVIQTYTQQFLESAIQLKKSQTELSTQTASLDAISRLRINPNHVQLQYYEDLGQSTQNFSNTSPLPKNYSFNILESIVQITSFAFTLAADPFSLVNHQSSLFQFITYNCMNSILTALSESTSAIIAQSNTVRESNISLFLVLLVGVSSALILSMLFLLPVIKRAKDNKQEVFMLFAGNKKVEKQVEEQLKKCRWFIHKYQQQAENQQEFDETNENHFGGNAAAAIEENTHMPTEKELKGNEDKKDDYITKVKKQKKKFKRLDNNFISIIFRLTLVILLIETFFLYTYLISKSFLEDVNSLTTELRLLISRQPQLGFLLLMQKELLYSNATQTFTFKPVKQVAEDSLVQQNIDYQELLKIYRNNFYLHTDSYNSEFEKIMAKDACKENTTEITQGFPQCKQINDQVMEKGIYSAVVEYWSEIRQLQTSYFGSTRNKTVVISLLNDPGILNQQLILESILKKSHWRLVTVLKEDIDQSFKQQYSSNQTVFALFIICVLFLYLVVWRIFTRNLLIELWRAKASLSLLPVDVCSKIEEVRAFIYRNSSQDGIGGKQS